MRLNIKRLTGVHRTGSLTPCPVDGCHGRLTVYSTHIREDVRVRYLHCEICHHKPTNNKVIVPLDVSPRRSVVNQKG